MCDVTYKINVFHDYEYRGLWWNAKSLQNLYVFLCEKIVAVSELFVKIKVIISRTM